MEDDSTQVGRYYWRRRLNAQYVRMLEGWAVTLGNIESLELIWYRRAGG